MYRGSYREGSYGGVHTEGFIERGLYTTPSHTPTTRLTFPAMCQINVVGAGAKSLPPPPHETCNSCNSGIRYVHHSTYQTYTYTHMVIGIRRYIR